MLLEKKKKLMWSKTGTTPKCTDKSSNHRIVVFICLYLYITISRVHFVIFCCSSIPVVLFDNPGIPKLLNTSFRLSPHLWLTGSVNKQCLLVTPRKVMTALAYLLQVVCG